MKTLSIKHLNKNKILNDINLDIKSGEIVAINDNLNMYINDHLRMYTSDYALI